MHVRLSWQREALFEAVEASPALVDAHAAVLCGWYNAPENASMMNGSGTMLPGDAVDFYRELHEEGGHGFLGFVDGVLVGDADLRGVAGGAAEFALMIGDRAWKGRGVGRTLATLVHVYAFRELELARVFVPPRRDNVKVHALNAFLGYARDDSEQALTFADGPESETYSLGADAFRARHPAAWRDVVCRRA